MIVRKSMMTAGCLGLMVFLASCDGDKEGVPPTPKATDAVDLKITPAEKKDPLQPKHSLSDDVVQGGYAPESILGQATPLFGSGNEPYWTVEIDKGWIVFERPGLPLVEVPVPEFTEAGDTLSLKPEGLSMTLTKNGCEGEKSSLGVVITFEEVEYQDTTEAIEYLGCAGTAPEADTDTTRLGTHAWKELIKPSIKAVDACLKQAGSEKLIVSVYPREPGTVGMIFRDAVGGYEECGADTVTGEVYFLDPMSADMAKDWMNGAAFVRSGQPLKCRAGGEALENGIGEYLPKGC